MSKGDNWTTVEYNIKGIVQSTEKLHTELAAMSQSPKSNSETNNPQDNLLDLYKLLGLQPLESDLAKIERAIIGLESKSAAADIKLAQRIARIVAIGRKNLLDPARKNAYDRAWRNQYGQGTSVAVQASASAAQASASQAAVETPQTLSATASSAMSNASGPKLSWDFSELELCLPMEDPHTAFDLATFLQSSETVSDVTMAADFDKLNVLLGGTSTMTATITTKAEPVGWDFSAVDEQGQPKSRETQTSANPVPTQKRSLVPEEDTAWLNVESSPNRENVATTATPNSAASQSRRPANAAVLARQLRKKRMQSMFFNIVGMLAALAVVFGVMYYLVTKDAKRSEVAALDPPPPVDKAPNDKAAVESIQPKSPAETAPQSSGLPKVPGMGVEPMEGNVIAGSEMEKDVGPMATERLNPEPAKPEPAAQPAPAMAETKPKTEASEAKPDPVPAPDPELTDAEKTQWAKSVEALRKSLGQQDFAASKKHLEELKQAAKVQIQRDQLKRLTAAAKLVEEFHEFLVNAVAGLGAGETFKIGNTPASFVEGSATSITIKMGRLQTYKFTELPNGVAYGLVNLQMDVENPISYARKAAFAWVHPKSNALTLKEAKAMMDKSATAGAVTDDMGKIFDDDYKLRQ